MIDSPSSLRPMTPDTTREPNELVGMDKDEFYKLCQSIVVTVLHRPDEGVSANLMVQNGFWGQLGMNTGPLEDYNQGFLELTRSRTAKTFLELCKMDERFKFHVSIDNDQDVPWDAPIRLAMWDLPYVSGVVCSYSQRRGIFACFTMKDATGKARFPSFNFTHKMPARGLAEVNSTGTGLLCVRKDTYQRIYDAGMYPFRIPDEARQQSFETGEMKCSEDIAFSRQCEQLGIKRYVDLSVHAIHNKIVPISWPLAAIDHEMDPRDWKIDPRDRGFGDA